MDVHSMSSTFRRHWGNWEDIRKRLRQVVIPRRVLIVVICCCFVLYLLISSLFSSSKPSLTESCIAERMEHWVLPEKGYTVSTSSDLPLFVGNGYFGIGDDEELRFLSNSKKVLSQLVSFFPIVSANIATASSEATATVIDYRNGVVKKIQCFSVAGECVCITRSFYAHRTRPHIFVQDITTTNPTVDPVKVELTTKESTKWVRGDSVDKTFVYSHVVDIDGVPNALGALCSFVPSEIVVARKREESERFICVFNYEPMKPNELMDGRKRISKTVSKEFSDVLRVKAADLDNEHENGWRSLNAVTFGISKSLAPNVLNAEVINATRYALLSNVRAPLLEIGVPPDKRNEAQAVMHKHQESMCYTGHSTLLVPRTALWQVTGSVDSLVQAASVWMLTLEKQGCSSFVKAGASGVAQAFVLSLLAAKFTQHHMEIEIDPADLHREITVEGISFSDKAKLSVAIHLDSENRPYFLVSSSSPVYICDAGCLDSPMELGTSRLQVPIKVTKPLTPILYFSDDKRHLEQLRNAIHIHEVVNAPAHEQELIALHKHGHRLGGLPVAFWILLGALVVVFHLFLFKLLYSEWKKADYTPYNYYLRQRYIRNH